MSVCAVLESTKGDKDALKAKLYAQIMLGRNEDALHLIQTQKSIAAEVVFEKAYCLFRTGSLDAALELLQGAEDEGSQHLLAIIHMRQKHSQAASTVYSTLAPKVKGNKQASIELVCTLFTSPTSIKTTEQMMFQSRNSLIVRICGDFRKPASGCTC